eukprot:Amastigsp_a508363_1104.p3 type:complete len:227 gc:universal Amastigsp_a508363_1104:810-1490(+)
MTTSALRRSVRRRTTAPSPRAAAPSTSAPNVRARCALTETSTAFLATSASASFRTLRPTLRPPRMSLPRANTSLASSAHSAPLRPAVCPARHAASSAHATASPATRFLAVSPRRSPPARLRASSSGASTLLRASPTSAPFLPRRTPNLTAPSGFILRSHRTPLLRTCAAPARTTPPTTTRSPSLSSFRGSWARASTAAPTLPRSSPGLTPLRPASARPPTLSPSTR